MQFLSARQAVDQYGHLIADIDATNEWYRTQLVFSPEAIGRQHRVGGGSPSGMSYAAFSHALLDWLGGEGARLLWVSHFEDGVGGYYELFEAARKGLGATGALSGQPGLAFRPAPYHEFGVPALSAEDRAYINIACGLISLVHLGAWDGWLIARHCSDRIEFWEGNVFFHSSQGDRLESGEDILRRFKCGQIG